MWLFLTITNLEMNVSSIMTSNIIFVLRDVNFFYEIGVTYFQKIKMAAIHHFEQVMNIDNEEVEY